MSGSHSARPSRPLRVGCATSAWGRGLGQAGGPSRRRPDRARCRRPRGLGSDSDRPGPLSRGVPVRPRPRHSRRVLSPVRARSAGGLRLRLFKPGTPPASGSLMRRWPAPSPLGSPPARSPTPSESGRRHPPSLSSQASGDSAPPRKKPLSRRRPESPAGIAGPGTVPTAPGPARLPVGPRASGAGGGAGAATARTGAREPAQHPLGCGGAGSQRLACGAGRRGLLLLG